MIPRRLHQIWIGGEPPIEVLGWMEGWVALHPEWEHHLWTDANRPRLRNEEAFRRAPSLAMKADLLRYELLMDHGGVYVDADYECHRPLDPLLGERSLLLVSEFGVVTNSLLGCEPGAAFLETLVIESGRAVLMASPKELESPHLVTGPYFVDRLYVEQALSFGDPSCLLPGDFFFPPRTRVQSTLTRARNKRYATHRALASWQKSSGLVSLMRRSKLRTRMRRFADLEAQ